MATHHKQENLVTNEEENLNPDEEPAPTDDESSGDDFFSKQLVYIMLKEYFEEKNIPPQWA